MNPGAFFNFWNMSTPGVLGTRFKPDTPAALISVWPHRGLTHVFSVTHRML